MSALLPTFTDATLAAFVAAALRATAPILLAALGGLISSVAGVINVALEGLMIVGAFAAVIASVYAGQWWPGLSPVECAWIGCLAGVLAAMLLAGLLAVFHLELGADLIVGGIAINLLAGGLTAFLLVSIVGDKGSTVSLNSPALPTLALPGLSPLPTLDAWLNAGGRGHHVLVWASLLAVPVVALVLSRTRAGVWLRATGENPQAAAGAGLPVRRLRYLALLASGAFCGLAGVYLSMGYLHLFQTEMTGGRGFLALAAVLVAGRRPAVVCGASLLFGVAAVLATRLGAAHWPTEVVYMVPALVTIAALVIIGTVKRAPVTP